MSRQGRLVKKQKTTENNWRQIYVFGTAVGWKGRDIGNEGRFGCRFSRIFVSFHIHFEV